MNAHSAVLSLAILLPAPAATQVWYGPQVVYATGTGPGVGVRAGAPLASLLGTTGEPLERVPVSVLVGLDYYFAGDTEAFGVTRGHSYWEAGAFATIPVERETTAKPYLGAGLTLGRASTVTREVDGQPVDRDGESSTSIGLNLLAGVRFPSLGLPMFVEARVAPLRQFVAAAAGQPSFLYLSVGITFGGR